MTESPNSPITFGIIGGGWRTEFFLRIAQALPDRFRVGGMFVRDAHKGQQIEAQWGVPTVRTLTELLALEPFTFVIVSVPWPVSPVMLTALAERHMPALAETPPAPDVESLIAVHQLVQQGAKIQVAEQYHLQPLHAARIHLARSGKLGPVTQAQVSAAHGYHGISLMRRLLGVMFDNVTIRARAFTSPIVQGTARDGSPPPAEVIAPSRQIIAEFDFGEQLGIFDFTGDQYHSWIRSPRLLVRGERGQINNEEVVYLQDFRTPISFTLQRRDAGQTGNLEGHYHQGILAGSEWVYRNPFGPARLMDDEIAVASCLQKMAEYATGGPDFYSLAEAAQDHYLNLLMNEAVEQATALTSQTQPWAT
jgi:predicted dehydrogenase